MSTGLALLPISLSDRFAKIRVAELSECAIVCCSYLQSPQPQ